MPIRLVCLDIDGTLTDGVLGPPIPGAVAAVTALRQRFPVRLVSNTTSRAHGELAGPLMAAGLLDRPESLITPVRVAARVLRERGHAAGLLIADARARRDYDWFREDPDGPSVLLATEGHALTLAELQPVFRRLLAGAHFYTLQRNRYFKKEGALVTDIGPLAAFLGYASGREPENLGKPSRLLFEGLARDLGIGLADIVMVGDDVEFDVSASVALGMQGLLVRTGKYRAGDEARVTPAPTAVLDSIAALPDRLPRGA